MVNASIKVDMTNSVLGLNFLMKKGAKPTKKTGCKKTGSGFFCYSKREEAFLFRLHFARRKNMVQTRVDATLYFSKFQTLKNIRST